MQIRSLDHVNIRTSQLDVMIDWYRDVLGLSAGARPDFSFAGAWIYIGDQAAIHLVDWDVAPASGDLTLEHFALGATGLSEFVEKLKSRDIEFTLDPVPGYPIVQVNLHDPDGNHIHVDFEASEAEGL